MTAHVTLRLRCDLQIGEQIDVKDSRCTGMVDGSKEVFAF